eukprot:6489661-Pyramimonas_sp.AAC.1
MVVYTGLETIYVAAAVVACTGGVVCTGSAHRHCGVHGHRGAHNEYGAPKHCAVRRRLGARSYCCSNRCGVCRRRA